MENYEQKYKDALSWMKDLYPTFEGATKEDAEHYFPELKESDDERIRKELIQHLKELSKVKDLSHTPIKFKQYYDVWIAWLEKQSEQKLINEYNEHEPTAYETKKWNEAYEKGYKIGYMNEKD